MRNGQIKSNQGGLIVAGTLEALSLAAFVCDREGQVMSMTPTAEAWVTQGGALRLSFRKLSTSRPEETRALNNALSKAINGLQKPGAPLSSTLAIQGDKAQPLVLEIIALPKREFMLPSGARALVIVRGTQGNPGRTKKLLQEIYGVTDAEAAVALNLADGWSPEVIALERATSVGTVRAQIRAIYVKLNAHRQSEVVSLINQLR